MIPYVQRLTLAALFVLFLIGGNAEAREAPCDNRPHRVCYA